MQLKEIREVINRVDADMKTLFEQRMEQSGYVAETKIASGDDVYKPLREKEMEQMYSTDKDAWYLMQLKKTVEISRKYQYLTFIDQHKEDTSFIKSLSEDNRRTLSEGGKLKLSFITDSDSMKGLDIKSVMSVVSSTELEILHMSADSDTGKVSLVFNVDNNEKSKKEAFLVAYMLYKETISK